MEIENKTIGKDRCFVIAEIGHNHQGSVELCKQMMDAAHATGADAVKLQKRDNRSLFTQEAYDKPYDNDNSFGKTYGEHREALEFGHEDYMVLKEHAGNLGLVFFATPFDIPSVRFLEKVGVPCYKIASAMITDTPLIEAVSATGKPVFMSTGACSEVDIDRAYAILEKAGNEVCLLHCIAAYPMLDYKDANMGYISRLRERYQKAVIGFSSHESGIMLPIAAYVLGARVVEKHFTLNRAMWGTDQKFSLEPSGMEKMVRDLRRIEVASGCLKQVQPSEDNARLKLGKGVYARRDISAGEAVSPDMVCFKSPAASMLPYEADELIGRTILVDMKKDQPLDMWAVSKERMKAYEKTDWGTVL